MENFENLEAKVLTIIIDKPGLDDADPSKVDYDAPIFASYGEEDEGLGLDCVDALGLVVGLKEGFYVKVSDEDMAIFRRV